MHTVYAGAFAIATAMAMLALVRVLSRSPRAERGAPCRAIVESAQTISVLVVTGAVVGGSASGEDISSDVRWVAISGAISAALLVGLGRRGASARDRGLARALGLRP